MNPVLILTHNNLELTSKAVESVFTQRVNTVCYVVDSGSKDGTKEWAEKVGILLDSSPFNVGVSEGWNQGLNTLFWKLHYEHVLVIGSDTILPEWFYGELLGYDVPFVTGVAVDQMPVKCPERMPLVDNPDFSAFLVKRQMWELVGPFNSRFFNYCSDCDMHVRAHRMGLKLWQANVPFFHQRSSTINNASPQEQAVLRAQAEADRGTFNAMYGCVPGDEKYPLLFK